jgi:membrane carboxypeptidase/penicillin-binding protein
VGLDQGVIEEALKTAKKTNKKAPKRVRLTGAIAALPVWIDIMKHALRFEPALPFAESDHLVDMRLDLHSGQKAEGSCPESQVVLEKVIAGREPKKSTCLPDYPKDID